MTSVIETGVIAQNVRSGEMGEIVRVEQDTATLRTPAGREVDRPLSHFVTITDALQHRLVGMQLIVGS